MVRTTTGAVWGKADVSGGLGKIADFGGSVESNGVLTDPGGALSRTPAGVSWRGNPHVRRGSVPDGIALVRWSFDKIPCEEENKNNVARSRSAPGRSTHG